MHKAKIKAAWQAAHSTKVADNEAVINHAPVQHTWTRCCSINKAEVMLIHSTCLGRSHVQAGGTSHAAVATSKDAVKRELSALMHAIWAGYHQKQVWSHKIWKGIDIWSVGGAGYQHGRVPRAVEEDTTGTDIWVEGRRAEAETNLLIGKRRARIGFGKSGEVTTCRVVQWCVDTPLFLHLLHKKWSSSSSHRNCKQDTCLTSMPCQLQPHLLHRWILTRSKQQRIQHSPHMYHASSSLFSVVLDLQLPLLGCMAQWMTWQVCVMSGQC